MSEILTFHFEGALANTHRMNFYESARFQYASARLVVKLAQFRKSGKFNKHITSKSNFGIELKSHTDGSFNINIEDPGQIQEDNPFIKISLSDLIAYISERVIEKISPSTLSTAMASSIGQADEIPLTPSTAEIDILVNEILAGKIQPSILSSPLQDLVKRRISEMHREKRLALNEQAISHISDPQGQKLIAMSAPPY